VRSDGLRADGEVNYRGTRYVCVLWSTTDVAAVVGVGQRFTESTMDNSRPIRMLYMSVMTT
jgi:hypothetical protein